MNATNTRIGACQSAGRVRLGVDLVDLGRIDRITRAYGDAFRRRVLDAEERRWCDGTDALVRTGVCFGAKEAAIKAAGGRWADFHWTDVAVRPGRWTVSSDLLTLVSDSLAEQFPEAQRGRGTLVARDLVDNLGSAVWCHDRHVVAVAVVM